MSNKSLPLVSIIMPTYNSSNYLEETITNIRNQDYSNWELLITDDKSTDNTVSIIKANQKEDSRIKLIELSVNSGAATARNTSLKKSKGEFIAFCDSDDLWKSTKLSEQISFMKSNSYDFTYTDIEYCNDVSEIIGFRNCPNNVDYNDLLLNCSIVCSTIIINRAKIGLILMPNLRKRQDWALWLKVIKKTNKAYRYPKQLTIYRETSNSISANKLSLIKYNWAVYRECEGMSLVKSLYYFIRYLLIYLKVKVKKKKQLIVK